MIDLLVAGGGPVGLVTALHAARQGMRVVVLEPRPAPIDKACGEGLMPGAVTMLHRLGIRPHGSRLQGIRYVAADRTSAVADFPHGTGGLGVRRIALHDALHAATVAAGADIRDDRATTIEHGDGWIAVNGIRAHHLVGADGLHSTIRRAAGLDRCADRHLRWGIRAHFACRPWTDRVEVHWSDEAEAYVTPVGPECVGVAVLGSTRGSFTDRLAGFPALAGRLPPTPITKPRAAGPLRQDAARRVAGRVLLVGDAAGYLDALTGEGLAIGFACAAAAVRRIAAGEVAGYERDYLRITRRYRAITAALLWAARHPTLRARIVPLAAAQPWLFRRAVAGLSGESG